MSRSQSNGGSGEYFHEDSGILWQWQHGDIFAIKPLTGSSMLSPETPQSIPNFQFRLRFALYWGARGISGTPPTAQIHKVPGPTLRARCKQNLKHLTNAGL